MFVKVCLQIPEFPCYLLLESAMFALTHLLPFWWWNSVTYVLTSVIFNTWFLCIIASEVSCKFLTDYTIKLKLLSWEKERLCVREEEIGLGKKQLFSFRLNLLKIASLNEAQFQGFVWYYYTVTIKNKFFLACRSSLRFRLFRTSCSQITRTKQWRVELWKIQTIKEGKSS